MTVIAAHVPRYGGLVRNGYPAYKYHLDGRAVVVKTDVEDVALGPGWFNTPNPEKQIAFVLDQARRADSSRDPLPDEPISPPKRPRGRPRKELV